MHNFFKKIPFVLTILFIFLYFLNLYTVGVAYVQNLIFAQYTIVSPFVLVILVICLVLLYLVLTKLNRHIYAIVGKKWFILSSSLLFFIFFELGQNIAYWLLISSAPLDLQFAYSILYLPIIQLAYFTGNITALFSVFLYYNRSRRLQENDVINTRSLIILRYVVGVFVVFSILYLSNQSRLFDYIARFTDNELICNMYYDSKKSNQCISDLYGRKLDKLSPGISSIEDLYLVKLPENSSLRTYEYANGFAYEAKSEVIFDDKKHFDVYFYEMGSQKSDFGYYKRVDNTYYFVTEKQEYYLGELEDPIFYQNIRYKNLWLFDIGYLESDGERNRIIVMLNDNDPQNPVAHDDIGTVHVFNDAYNNQTYLMISDYFADTNHISVSYSHTDDIVAVNSDWLPIAVWDSLYAFKHADSLSNFLFIGNKDLEEFFYTDGKKVRVDGVELTGDSVVFEGDYDYYSEIRDPYRIIFALNNDGVSTVYEGKNKILTFEDGEVSELMRHKNNVITIIHNNKTNQENLYINDELIENCNGLLSMDYSVSFVGDKMFCMQDFLYYGNKRLPFEQYLSIDLYNTDPTDLLAVISNEFYLFGSKEKAEEFYSHFK